MSSIMAGDYTGVMDPDAPFLSGPANAILLLGGLLGTRTGIYIHNETNIDPATTTGCILVGEDFGISLGRRQQIYDFISARENLRSPQVRRLFPFPCANKN